MRQWIALALLFAAPAAAGELETLASWMTGSFSSQAQAEESEAYFDIREPEALTHESVWLMDRVGAPVPSPDGRWVVFSVMEPSYEEEGDVTDLWVVPTDGSAEPRRLTSGEGGEGDPVWSGDSRKIAFTAKRGDDQKNQVYILDFAAGGEATRLTDAPLGARRPQLESGWRDDALPERGAPRGGGRGEQSRVGRGVGGAQVEGAHLRGFPDSPLGPLAGRHPDPSVHRRGAGRRRGARPAGGHRAGRCRGLPGARQPGGRRPGRNLVPGRRVDPHRRHHRGPHIGPQPGQHPSVPGARRGW